MFLLSGGCTCLWQTRRLLRDTWKKECIIIIVIQSWVATTVTHRGRNVPFALFPLICRSRPPYTGVTFLVWTFLVLCVLQRSLCGLWWEHWETHNSLLLIYHLYELLPPWCLPSHKVSLYSTKLGLSEPVSQLPFSRMSIRCLQTYQGQLLTQVDNCNLGRK